MYRDFTSLGSAQFCFIDLFFLCNTPTEQNPVNLEQGSVNTHFFFFWCVVCLFVYKLSFILVDVLLCFSVSPVNEDLSAASFNLFHVRGLLNT